MAINTFGVTPAVIVARAQNLSISLTSAPDTAVVTDIISEVSSDIADECAAVGIDAASAINSGATEGLYLQCRRAVISGVIDTLILARNPRGAPVDRSYKALYDETVKRIREKPQTVSDQSNVDVTIDLGAPEYASRTFVPGLGGKIVRGGL